MVLSFAQRLSRGPILADGAMGTELLRRGNLGIGSCLEQLNITHPNLARGVHLDYIEAGAELIQTNSYGATRVRLEQHGLAGSVQEINRKAVEIAREAQRLTGQHVWIAGSVGPLGKSLVPLGPISPAQAQEIFREQIQALVEAGADLLLLETFTDLAEIREAIAAANTIGTLPIIAQLTFTEEGNTPAGETPAEVAEALSSLKVASLGTNCSVGPVPMLRVIEEMTPHATVPLSAMPNAGFPSYVDGRFVYLSSPGYMAEHAGRLLELGAAIIGGCCGTTPEHIAAMRETLRNHRPSPSTSRSGTSSSGRLRAQEPAVEAASGRVPRPGANGPASPEQCSPR